MYILPLCMLAVFVTVWNRTMAQPYALAVQVNGQTVGYVANEEVFNLAKEDVMQRINYAGSDKTELTIEPTYTISVTNFGRLQIVCVVICRQATLCILH